MAVTMKQVLAAIDRDEPDYAEAAKLGPDALPHLAQIAEASDLLRASKAAYLASLIPGAASADLLQTAAKRHEPEVRVAVAHALRNLSDTPDAVFESLLADADVGVRKVAIATVGRVGPASLKQKLTQLSENDPEEHLRVKAGEALRALKAR
jgi:HEAT repeat protein